MSNIFTQSQAYQSSSAPTVFGDQFIFGDSFQSSSQACIVDLTSPTFSGINYLRVESRGQIRAKWTAASDATAPIRYEIYIQEFTATGLFSSANIIAITDKLQYDTFTMPDGSFLYNGSTYHVGVRAIDGVNNRDNNTVSLNVISTGVLTSIDTYDTEGSFSLAKAGMFQGTMWARKNGELCTPSNCTLGTASFSVYDKTGTVVSGMSQSGIVADSNGQFKITAISSGLSEKLEHYVVKVSILVDGEIRNDYVSIVQKIPAYTINGHNSFNNDGDFIGIFWAEDENRMHISDPSRLGLGSYDVLDKDGNIVLGFSENNISPNSNGMYVITPVSGVSPEDINLVTGRITIVVDGITRTSYIPANIKPIDHRAKAVFSINALNQLQATLWAENTLGMVVTNNLGTASYSVYDASGNPVSGLTQSGMTPDVNGRYTITPTSAALLTDLTHYTAKIEIVIEGTNHTSYKGFTLLGN